MASSSSSPQRKVNGHSSSSSVQHSARIIQVENFTSDQNSRHSNSASYYSETQTVEEKSGKSFIQQRIERLYGPAALGMGFLARRALMERNQDVPIEETKNNCVESSQGLPRVFRHLRPEFRHQLPVKTRKGCGWDFNHGSNEVVKIDCCSSDTITNGDCCSSDTITNGVVNGYNGHTVRHIPIVVEDRNGSNLSEDKPDRSSNNNSNILSKIVNGGPSVTKESNGILIKPVKKDVAVVDLKKIPDSKKNNFIPTPIETKPQSSLQEVKDGNHFLQVVSEEVSRLEPLVQKVEEDLATSGEVMSEEVRGKLLAASGKAKLLINQKIEQFRGLCRKNINKSTTEEFPTTNEDLAGFWDMVSIQVVNIKELLEEVDKLRNNQWIDIPQKPVNGPPTKATITRKLKSNSSAPASGATKDSSKTKAANEERRKAMREAINAKRKVALKNKDESDQVVEIFIS